MSEDIRNWLYRIDNKIDKLEGKIDKNQELLFTHITNDTRMLEQLTAKMDVVENEQKWFKRLGIGFCALCGSVLTWIITYLSGMRH
jgi:predicted  nucleic acid-binding Zn-ribbon protein